MKRFFAEFLTFVFCSWGVWFIYLLIIYIVSAKSFDSHPDAFIWLGLVLGWVVAELLEVKRKE